jgi:hypothetical protein
MASQGQRASEVSGICSKRGVAGKEGNWRRGPDALGKGDIGSLLLKPDYKARHTPDIRLNRPHAIAKQQ